MDDERSGVNKGVAVGVGVGVVIVGLVFALPLVVAIIGILAAIAIPNFLVYTYRAKLSETDVQLTAIRDAEEAYRAQWGTYAACPIHPDPVVAPPGREPRPVAANPCWDALGVSWSGSQYCSYSVETTGSLDGMDQSFEVVAYCDVDEDYLWSEFVLGSDDFVPWQRNPGEW